MLPPLRLAFCVTVFVLSVCLESSSCFNLTVLHTNDVHSHFIEFNAFGGRCTESLAKEKKCYGGFARQVTKMKEIRANEENVIFLNGGDFYQGTVWYTLHKWQVVADLLNKLQIDVMSLGNHEFDDGLDGLFPLLKRLNDTQVVVCNINSTLVPEFGEYVKPSVILDVGGERIGVIGYLTTETKFLSSTGALEFEDEVECIQREARRLVEEEGLNKIIAVGHAGFTVDQDIARRVPEVDIVVGGHTNTFLYSGEPPSNEETQGPYPLVVERENGSIALVVQDFAFGKFLGHLRVQFDDEGRIAYWGGNPILMDSSVPEDAETLEILRPYGEAVRRRVRQTVGRTHVLLLGDRRICRMRECNLGNMMADAALDHFVQQPSQEGWNFVAIALWNSGSIRGSIDERINQGNVTIEDILTAAPFGNTMCVVGLKGKHLRQVLEHSVKDYDLEAVDPPGSFLQVSGLRLKYNMSQPVGSRLLEAMARCADCRIPKYLPLEDEKVYEMVVNTYLAKGGDGFDMVQENAVTYRNVDELDIDILINYVQKHSPIITGLEDRITILPSEPSASDDTTQGTTTEQQGMTQGTTTELFQPTTELFSQTEVTTGTVEETFVETLEKIPKTLQNVPNEITKILPFKL